MLDLLHAANQAMEAGRWDDALASFEAALRRAPACGTAADVADILRRIGSLHRVRGEMELASELYETSLAISELNQLDLQAANALLGLGTVAVTRGHLDEAEGLLARARTFAVAQGDARIAAMAEQNLGVVANIRGDVAGALDRYLGALAHHRRLGDDNMCAHALNNVGMAHVDLGSLDRAEECFQEAITLASRGRDERVLGSIVLNRAELLLKRKAFAEARHACDFAVEIFDRLGATPDLAEVHRFYGAVYRETGKLHLADIHLRESVRLARQCEDQLREAEAESERALLLISLEQNAEALRCLNRAHEILGTLQARRDIADLERRFDSLEGTFLRAVRAWAESIESKDRYTAGHCDRVAEYACMLAEAAGMRGRDLTWFRMGAILHDVGKIHVPNEILNKPGKLTPEEWETMQSHAVYGDDIVAGLNFPWDIRPIVRSHHEHWVGTGYPDGLKGEEIPLHARILCVADVYDALTSARSYKPALPREEALRIMEGDSGRIFDPSLFSLFRSLIDRRSESTERHAGQRDAFAA